jgi:probable rRNA maturation factor
MTRVCFTWERRPGSAAAHALRAVAGGVVDRLLARPAEVHVLVTDDIRIRDLNRRYRKVDSATDVLSFPDGTVLPDGVALLGQIVISLETARRQAAELGHGELRELQELVLHGVLHLRGELIR